MGCTSQHPDLPRPPAGTGCAGSGLQGHTCPECVGVRACPCGALPALQRGEGLLTGLLAPAPGRGGHSCQHAAPSEKGLTLAWLWYHVLGPMPACKPSDRGCYLLGGRLGTAGATPGRSDVRVSACRCPPPPAAETQALPSLPSGLAPKWPPGFQGLPPWGLGTLSSWGRAVGRHAQPLLEWNSQRSQPGAWHRNPTCFVSGISWRAGHVATCVRPERGGPEGSSGRVLLARSLPLSLWARPALSGHQAVLKHGSGSLG